MKETSKFTTTVKIHKRERFQCFVPSHLFKIHYITMNMKLIINLHCLAGTHTIEVHKAGKNITNLNKIRLFAIN